MKVYNTIYRFEAFTKLAEGEVYVADKQNKTINKVSEMSAGQLSAIMERPNKDNRFEFWVESDAGACDE